MMILLTKAPAEKIRKYDNMALSFDLLWAASPQYLAQP
jgi:hypothetical protein